MFTTKPLALPLLLLTLTVHPARLGQAAEPVPDLRTRVSGSDWPRFLGPDGNNKSTETGIQTDWPSGGPTVVWAKAVGEGYAGPTVSKGRLFHFDRAGTNARLVCLESETGSEIWRAEYPMEYEDYYGYSNGPRASPLVDDDRVYTFGVEGRLRAHRVVDGELLWDIDTTAEFGVVQNFFGVGSTPAIEGDLLIAPVGGSPPDAPKIHSGNVTGNGSGIVAFDKWTGEVLYQVTDELASYASPMLTTIGDRRWGFAFMRDALVGFEPSSGAVDFRFPWKAKILESVNASSPVLVDDTVLISETYGPGSALLRVSPGGYEVVWQDPPGRNKAVTTHWNTPLYHEGHLYASSGRNTGDTDLICLEHATGERRWTQPGLGRSTLLYADDHLFVLGEHGKLTLVRATPTVFEAVAETDFRAAKRSIPSLDGGERELPLLSYPAWNAPVLSHGLLYLRAKDTLIALQVIPD